MINNKEFERYAAYKDSGVEWLVEVPEHWKIKRVKDFSVIIRGGSPRPAGDSKFYYGNIPFLKVGNLTSDEKVYLSTYTHTIKEAGLTNTTLIKENTLLLTNSGATLGIPKICTFQTTFNDGIAAFTHLKNINKILLFYFLKSKTKWYLNQAAFGQGQPNLNIEIIANTHIPYPTISEQQVIADYLDNKTAQIDRKIHLLTQKASLYSNLKQSLINETVTRGLDKTVPMKDSGVEWIGEIPTHWAVRRLKDYVRLFHGYSFSEQDFSEDISDKFLVKITELKNNKVFLKESSVMLKDNPVFEKYRIRKNEALIALSGATAGKISIFDLNEKCYLNQRVAKILSDKNLIYKFLFYFLNREEIVNEMYVLSNITAQPNFNNNILFINCLIPPIEEQQAIANYLDEKTTQIDQIIQTINSQIDKLKELRKALINDVVTGKIKITNEVSS